MIQEIKLTKISKINITNQISKIKKINAISKINKINEFSKINKTINGIDKETIKKNAIPMIFCFITWAVVNILLLYYTGLGIVFITTFLLLTMQLIASINDLYNKTIPLKLIISGSIIGLLIFIVFNKSNALIICLFGGVTAFALMKLLILISKRQVGEGDLALMTATGFYAGINNFFSILFISIVLTGLYSLFLVFTKKGDRKTEIPFAPFVLLATIICELTSIR